MSAHKSESPGGTGLSAEKNTNAAIHGHIFKSQDRFDSKGRKIAGNGLALTGAIIRRGRKVLIDVDRYGAWLSGGGA